MIAPFRWDLVPRLSALEVRALATLSAHVTPAAAATLVQRVFGNDARATLGPVFTIAPDGLGAALPAEVLLLHRPDGRVLAVGLDAPLAIAAAAAVLGDPETEAPLARLLTPPERGVLRYLAAAACDAALEVGSVTDAAAALPLLGTGAVIAVDVRVAVRGRHGTFRLAVPEALLQAPPPERALDPARADAIPIRFRAAAGGVRLSRADLAQLEPGDVVVLDRALAGLRAGRLCARLSDLTLASELEMASQKLIDDLPVELHAELGAVTMSARAAMELSPGAVVRLDRPAGGPVDLTANGRVIARGELVTVDDKLGVRVLELLG